MWNRRIIAAALAALGMATTAYGQSADLRQEDRRADRQEDRQQDRQEDRQADRQQDRRQNGREVRLDLPRAADGTIDTAALTTQVRDAFQNGARDVRIREKDLTAQERQQLADFARTLGTQVGADRIRVRDDGIRIRADRRADRPERTARAERPERAERVERAERPERAERVERPERVERAERVERPERSGHH